jgi:hypothetical protein
VHSENMQEESSGETTFYTVISMEKAENKVRRVIRENLIRSTRERGGGERRERGGKREMKKKEIDENEQEEEHK